jgi:hypothetical protein
VSAPDPTVGALAPAQALDPEAFLDAVSGDDFSWTAGFPVPKEL